MPKTHFRLLVCAVLVAIALPAAPQPAPPAPAGKNGRLEELMVSGVMALRRLWVA